MAHNDVEGEFVAILERLKKYEDEKLDQSFGYDQIKGAINSKASILKYFDYHYNITRDLRKKIEGKVIVDAGSGSGAFSVLLSLLGAKKVYAVDFIIDCVEMTRNLAEIANIKNIEVIHSDIVDVDFPNASVDGIFSIEAISHYRKFNEFFVWASSALRRGGFLAIIDGNNAASPQIRNMNYKIWDCYETCTDEIPIFGHTKRQTSYLKMREEIIKNEFPELGAKDIETYAKFTFAYSKEQIIQAVNQFMSRDFSMKSEYHYGKCPLDPFKDIYMEYLFHPRQLKNDLRKLGFISRIKSLGPASRKYNFIRYFWELFTPITIFLPRGFQLNAIRQ